MQGHRNAVSQAFSFGGAPGEQSERQVAAPQALTDEVLVV